MTSATSSWRARGGGSSSSTPTVRLPSAALASVWNDDFLLPSYLHHSTFAPSFFLRLPPLGDSSIMGHLTNALGPSELRNLRAADRTSILLPTCWASDDKCTLLDLADDGVTLSFGGNAKFGDRDAAAVRSERPVPVQAGVYYYEVTVISKGTSGFIGVGLSERTVSLSRLPGWEAGSFGYHADDGLAFCSQGTGDPYGPTFGTGDVIGCGIDWTTLPSEEEGKASTSAAAEKMGRGTGGARVFFTKNGRFLGYAFTGLQGTFYPSCGLQTPGEQVRANFGAEPFEFDIDSYVLGRRKVILKALATQEVADNILLPPPPAQQKPAIPSFLPPTAEQKVSETVSSLVLSYLHHHGYASTAAAYARELAEDRLSLSKGFVEPVKLEELEREREATPARQDDAKVRAEVRKCLLKGEVYRSFELLKEYYPSMIPGELVAVKSEDEDKVVVEEPDPEGDLLFRLRVRDFLEACLRADFEGGSDESSRSEDGLADGMEMDSGISIARLDKGKGKAFPVSMVASVAAVSTDISPSPPWAPSGPLNLPTLLSLGRALHESYASDTRPKVQETLKVAFSALAYQDPREAGGKLGKLMTAEAREELAGWVNGKMLLSRRLPSRPHLEGIYRQAEAVRQTLGNLGGGGAVLVPPLIPTQFAK